MTKPLSINPTDAPVLLRSDDFGLDATGPALGSLQALWDGLPVDPYVPDGPVARRRAFCTFDWQRSTGVLARLAHRPYFQEKSRNQIYGGMQRQFAPCRAEVARHAWVETVVTTGAAALPSSAEHLLIHCHQVRIVTTPLASGEPSPEGLHSDGFDYVSIHLIRKEGCIGGVTVVVGPDDQVVLEHELALPLEALYIDDRRYRHVTSPIRTEFDIGARDVLLLSYSESDSSGR
jgi:hypothetical protein